MTTYLFITTTTKKKRCFITNNKYNFTYNDKRQLTNIKYSGINRFNFSYDDSDRLSSVNDVYNDLITILGLKFGKEFDIKDLNFGKIVISTDADVDGDKIAALLLLFFSNWPELIEKHIVCRSISPIIIAKKGKERKKYYSIAEFKADEKKLKSGWMIKYAKGLSGLDAVETKEMMRNPIFMYFEYDSNANSMFKRWFGKDSE